MIKDGQVRKQNGVYYSPPSLAALLAEGLNASVSSILDPACGEGALLEAVTQRFQDAGKRLHSVGCDIFEPARPLAPKGAKFVLGDFMEFDTEQCYDAVVMNPPYVNFGQLSTSRRKGLHQKFGERYSVPGNADLWVYFILKSLRHIRPGGDIAAILPWALLEADYARSLRAALAENFGAIRVLALNREHFEDTDTRVVLLWCHGFGNECNSLELAFATDHESAEVNFTSLSLEEWTASSLFSIDSRALENLQSELREKNGFEPFSKFASVRIGMVTGANAYFIMSPDQARLRGFDQRLQVPTLSRGDELRGLAQDGCEQVLVRFGEKLTKRRAAYVEHGKGLGLHKRSHCRRRSPWYAVDPDHSPDAFMTYRVSEFPLMVLNPQGFQCTNSIHRVYFNRGVSENRRKWLQLSLLSLPSLLQLENKSRHYGRCVMKIEPGILKDILCFPGANRVPSKIYSAVSELTEAGRRLEASRIATTLIAERAGFKKSFVNQLVSLMNDLRARRGRRLYSL